MASKDQPPTEPRKPAAPAEPKKPSGAPPAPPPTPRIRIWDAGPLSVIGMVITGALFLYFLYSSENTRPGLIEPPASAPTQPPQPTVAAVPAPTAAAAEQAAAPARAAQPTAPPEPTATAVPAPTEAPAAGGAANAPAAEAAASAKAASGSGKDAARRARIDATNRASEALRRAQLQRLRSPAAAPPGQSPTG